MKTIVVSAVNLRKGGTLAILRDCLQALSEMVAEGELRVVALVHDSQLADYPGIEYIELPWSIRSWMHRLWCEYVTMHGISKRLGDIDLWLSLHDTTPRVNAKRQAVYCHNSYPFFRWQWHHVWQNYRIVSFALFTKLFYRINLHRNDFVIVQSQWFREAFAEMMGFDKQRIVVFPPDSPPALPMREGAITFPKQQSLPSANDSAPSLTGRAGSGSIFLFPAYPDVHKNFECLCEAARLLEEEVGEGRFEVLLTTDRDFNRYSRWLDHRWGHVKSIRFCGFVSKERLNELYAQAKCLVFPSQVETWGLPISEFAVTDRPMLLADRPYAHETAAGSHHTAFFDPDKPNQLKQLMRDVMEGRTQAFKNVPKTTIATPLVHSWKQLFKEPAPTLH